MNQVIEINPLNKEAVKKRFKTYTATLETNMKESEKEIKDDVNIRLLKKKYDEVRDDVKNGEWIDSLFIGNYFDTLDYALAFNHPLSQVYTQLIYTYITDVFQEKILKLPVEYQRLIAETLVAFDMNPYSYKLYIEFMFNSRFMKELNKQFKNYDEKINFTIDVIDTASNMGITTSYGITEEAIDMMRDKGIQDKSFDNIGIIFSPPIFTIPTIYKTLFSLMTEINEFFVIFNDQAFEDLDYVLKIGESSFEIQQEFFTMVRNIDLEDSNKIMKIKDIIGKAKDLIPIDKSEDYRK